MKKCLIYLSIIGIANISFLFSPQTIDRGPNSRCPHQYIRINAVMGFPMNCDAFTFMGSAIDPSYLLQPGFERQSRPLYIIFGSLTTYTLYIITYPFHGKIESLVRNEFSGEFSQDEQKKAAEYVSSYAGFIFINVLVLLVSFYLFEIIVARLSGKWKNGRLLWFLLLMMLASNQATKTFFWTPHQQMLNILTPLLCVFTGMKIILDKTPVRNILFMSLTAGLGVLLYGNFLLLWPVILLSYLYSTRHNAASFPKTLFTSFLITLLFCLPSLLWILFLEIRGVGFYSYEFDRFREFVWMLDALRTPGQSLLRQLYLNLATFFETFGSVFLIGGFLIFSVAYRKFFPAGWGSRMMNTARNKTVILFGLVLCLLFLFLWLLGYYADRLTFSFAPLLLCISAITINQQRISKLTEWTLILLLVAIHFYTMFFNAPHFSDRFYY